MALRALGSRLAVGARGARARRARAAPVSVHVRAAAVAAPPTEVTHGFEAVRKETLTEYGAVGTLYRHVATGAELMSVEAPDENKTFGIVFRTPPANSTGIPHILEHSVLCGSRKYPIKEPFVELMKGSLNTFLNAFTYPDRTCYPVASCNLQDFYNLVDVYMDAVFHPKCIDDEGTFQQEGWHYEMNDKEGPVTFKGVVFNEMKGVYSSPDSVLYREIQQSLFPVNTYGVDSGGDPEAIPDLSFEEFKDFHSRYYHPSNARIWFYGDDPVEERLRITNEFLQEFEARDVSDSRIAVQPLFTEPQRIVRKYVVSKEDGEDQKKHFVSLNWLLEEHPFDTETALAFGFLNHMILGTPASPLRKALEESGLGESMVGGGIEDELRQPTFSLGLKGVAPEDVGKVEELIERTIAELAETGLPEATVQSSMNTIEFALRENNTGRFPRGLSLMLRSMATWLYELDPFEPLRFEAPLAHLKERIASGEDVFRPLLRKYLIENPHKVTLEMQPDANLGDEMEGREQERLDAKRASMGADEIEALVADTEALKLRQETPDDPEALKCMPSLALSDIPKEAATVPTAVAEENGATVLRHDLFTNDILYADVLFDMRRVPARLLPLVPLFCQALTSMGTSTETFVELNERMGSTTGGVSISPFTSAIRGDDDFAAYVTMRGKAMSSNAEDLFSLMRDIMLDARLDDQAKFKQLVLENRSGMESRVVGSGHSVAAVRLQAQRSTEGWVAEQMRGFEALEYLRTLAKRVDEDWAGVQADLEAIRSALVTSEGAVVNLTLDDAGLTRTQGALDGFMSALPSTGGALESWSGVLPRQNELLTVPTQVNYVGKAANLYEDAGYDLSGTAYVINKLLGTTYLWDKVRVSGGAYGGFSDFDSHSGNFVYLSYRDPNLLGTVDAYDGTPEFLRQLSLDSDALTKSIVGTIGDIDAYMLPDAKGYTALMRHLLKVTDEERQERREQILATTNADFKAFADVLEAARGDAARVVAVCSPEAAAAAAAERPGLDLKVTKVL